MALSLRQKQSIFVVLVARLINYATGLGYELTFGEALRSPEEAIRLARLGVGKKDSLHISKLAIDLNLFIDGKYQPSTLAHRQLGMWWEKQSRPPLYVCCWGGHFNDGNHYSVSHNGKK